MPNDPADDLEVYWESLGVTRRPDLTPDQLREQIAPEASRNDLVIGTRGNPLVVLKPDGTLVYGPQYTPDTAALHFWEALARRRVDYEQRMLLFAHMDALLTRIGQRDMAYENLRLAANEEGLTPILKAEREMFADLALRRLEIEVHQAIELGRGLAQRNTEQPPPAEQVTSEPPQVDPDSSPT